MLNLLSQNNDLITGTVERVGAVGFSGDVYYMTLLLKGSNIIYRIFFNDNDSDNYAASLTQTGDVVEFVQSEHDIVKIKNFVNKTVEERLKQQESKLVKEF